MLLLKPLLFAVVLVLTVYGAITRQDQQSLPAGGCQTDQALSIDKSIRA